MIPIRYTSRLSLVLLDTPDPIVVPAIAYPPISLAQWEDGRTPFLCLLGSTGLPADCTGGAFIFTGRRPGYGVEDPILSKEGIEVDYSAGNGYFDFGSVDTGVPVMIYKIDVDFIDSTGKRWQCLLASDFSILEAEGVPGSPITPSESQNPLAHGLPGTRVYRQIFGGAASAGDTIIFDSTLSPALGQAGLRALKNAAFDPNTMAIFGWLLEDVALDDFALMRTQGILLTPDILPTLAPGQLTIDLSSGLIRNLVPGEPRMGLADGNGNAFLLSPGFIA